ncbi:MAG: addiction module antidote protein, HigA family [Candidatus Omnitrophica bacterium]|nr:addiction module antidote protein, HigA family [Candidatus Omnitrophota bacterium]
MTQYCLAKDISVPARRINEIVKGERSLSDDTALQFSHYFGNSPQFWIHLQAQYDLDLESARLGKTLNEQVKSLKRAA